MASDGEDTQCWFCWDEVTAHDRAPALGCFCKGALTSAHKTCMKEWLVKHPESCPNCRQAYDQRAVAALVSPRASVKSGRPSGSSRPSLRAVRHASPLAHPEALLENSHRRRQVLRDALDARRRAHDDRRRSSQGRAEGPQLRRSSRLEPPADPSAPLPGPGQANAALAEVQEGVALIRALLRATREELAAAPAPAVTPPAAAHAHPASAFFHPAHFNPFPPTMPQQGTAAPRHDAAAMAPPPAGWMVPPLAAPRHAFECAAEPPAAGAARDLPHAADLRAELPLLARLAPRCLDTLPLSARAIRRATASPLPPPAADPADLPVVIDDDDLFALPRPPFNSPAAATRACSRRAPTASPAAPRLRLRAARAAVRRAAGQRPGDSSGADDSADDNDAGTSAGHGRQALAGTVSGPSGAAAAGTSRAAGPATGGRGLGATEREDEEAFAVMVSGLGRRGGAPVLRPLAARPAIRKLRVPRAEWEVIDLTADDEH